MFGFITSDARIVSDQTLTNSLNFDMVKSITFSPDHCETAKEQMVGKNGAREK